VEPAARREVDAEQEALWTSVERVRDLVLCRGDGLSSLAASMSAVVKRVEGQINAAATNQFHWRSHFVLVDAVSHFPMLKAKLELHGSRRSADLIEDEANVVWSRVRAASDSLTSHVPSSAACNPPDGTVE
jgi:ribosomal protein S12 methylthiotransferase accessory factor YcaO